MKPNILYAGLVALTIPFYSCAREQPQKSLPEAPAPPVVDTTPPVREYTVQKGDYLAKIVYNELGARGEDAMTKGLLRIQELNSNILTTDRDLYKPIDCSEYLNSDTAVGTDCPKFVSGKDGIADLIYPGEKLRLN